MNLGDYIIYVDESGDHGLQNIDPDYPVFVLSFCCFRIEHCINQAVPQMQRYYRQCHKKIHFIFEKPGKKEDGRLSDEFKKISDNQAKIG